MSKRLELAICDTQGQIFVLSKRYEFYSEAFIKAYMISQIAADMDKPFHHYQWAGREYVFATLLENCKEKLFCGVTFDEETLYWIGYVYRFWHLYTGESSKEIYKQAPANLMKSVYLSYHTLSPEMVVDRLKETYKIKRAG